MNEAMVSVLDHESLRSDATYDTVRDDSMMVEPSFAFAANPDAGGAGGSLENNLAPALVADELGHRLRNVLAVVDAIVRQTLRGPIERGDLAAALSRRFAALAEANDLVRARPKAPSRMGDVVEAALSPFGGNTSGQFAGGGPDIRLGGGLAIVMALVLHELATNALKHGALSVAAGRVWVRWERAGDEIAFAWGERGGPPVRPLDHEGSGLRMIREALAPHVADAPEVLRRREGILVRFRAKVAREPQASPRGSEPAAAA